MTAYPQLKVKLAGQDVLGYMQGLQINQNTDGHHGFTVHLPADDMSKNFIGSTAALYKKLLGSTITVDGLFEGIVTSMNLSRSNAGMSTMVVRGQSNTILMEDGFNTRSFAKQTLKQIIDTVFKDYKSKIGEVEIKPTYTTPIEYTVQYRESNFAFINRLAARYSEWFFYDGQKLVFGQPKKGIPIKLKLGGGVTHFNIAMKAVPLNFKMLSYDYNEHKTLKDEPNDPGLKHEYAKIAYDKSKKEIFPHKPQVPINMSMTQKDLDHISELRQHVYLDELVVLSGSSANPDLRVGSIIEIVDERENLVNTGTDKYGQYVITHLTHEFGSRGETYSNHFEGIPSDDKIPLPPLSVSTDPPPCEMQEAKVMENNCPNGMGRVKVQFIWQEEKNEMTDWIRVTSPQGGGDKGFYFLPEKGDQVLVAFEHDHPEHPYVLTGVYHGKTKPKHHDPDNNKKGWTTKGGNEILFHDTVGVYVYSSKLVDIKAADGQMTLNAKKDVIVSSTEGNIEISCKGNTIKMNKDGDITITSEKGKIVIKAKEDVTIDAKNIKITGTEGIALKAPKIKIEADSELSASGAQVSIEGKATTAVKGAMLNVEATGIATIKGTLVKIN